MQHCRGTSTQLSSRSCFNIEFPRGKHLICIYCVCFYLGLFYAFIPTHLTHPLWLFYLGITSCVQNTDLNSFLVIVSLFPHIITSPTIITLPFTFTAVLRCTPGNILAYGKHTGTCTEPFAPNFRYAIAFTPPSTTTTTPGTETTGNTTTNTTGVRRTKCRSQATYHRRLRLLRQRRGAWRATRCR